MPYYFCAKEGKKLDIRLYQKKCIPDVARGDCRNCPHRDGLKVTEIDLPKEPTKEPSADKPAKKKPTLKTQKAKKERTEEVRKVTGQIVQDIRDKAGEERDLALSDGMALSLPSFQEPSNINDAVDKLRGLGSSLSGHVYLIGKTLLWIKEQVGHGGFEAWVEKNLWFTPRTARRFMAHAVRCEQEGNLLPYNPSNNTKKRTDHVEVKTVSWAKSLLNLLAKHESDIMSDLGNLLPQERQELTTRVTNILSELTKK